MTTAMLAAFNDKEITYFVQDGEVWISLQDLAKAWGTARTTPYNLVKRNMDIFEGKYSDGDETKHPGGFVNELGLYVLMGRISADRLKDHKARAAIIAFQRWLPELVQQYRTGALIATGATPGADRLHVEMEKARAVAKELGGRLRECQRIAIQQAGLEPYAAVLDLPPACQHGEAGGQWMNATDIGNLTGHSPEDINRWLYSHDFVYPESFHGRTIWRLTVKGEEHGMEYQYETTSNHKEPRIRWRPTVIEASGLKRKCP